MLKPKSIPQITVPTKLAVGKPEVKKTIATQPKTPPPPAIMPKAELPVTEPVTDETIADTPAVEEKQVTLDKPAEPKKLSGGLLVQFGEVKAVVNDAVATVNSMVDGYSQLQSAVAALQNADTVTPEAVEALAKVAELDALKESLAAHSAIDGRLTELVGVVDGHGSAVAELQGRINGLVESSNEVISAINSLNESVEVIVTNLWGDE